MDESENKPHSNKLPSEPSELLKFVAEGLEGEAVGVDLDKLFHETIDELIKDGFEHRKQA